ncbi:hypothetical protein BDV95DRAFT_664731 [Massariosphaeria phaeospora]|uniref:Hepatocellular carcinoma-associated antigen 59-domain-containing protein n=1 Tax=Massariosphaeria phaeospora TaxID=100035 RepID=A0A7C8MLY6_9PLEO|nr:hypothetical protein BDV95DRAFT_664731 [Massariosphaeria phaeospora]
MDERDQDNTETTPRFKRRKVAQAKRLRLDDDASSEADGHPRGPSAPVPKASTMHSVATEIEDAVPSLKEILRNRRRPRDRLKEAARNAEATKAQALVHVDVPKPGLYASRFIAQTGQVKDKDDKQMAEYVEARMAERNHRLYGWPIPKQPGIAVHPLEPSTAVMTHVIDRLEDLSANMGQDHSDRLAAGMGKLQEVDLGPDATTKNIQRTEAARRQLEGRDAVQIDETDPGGTSRTGKRRRPQKRRNSEDMRRDQMVEAVLREAKCMLFFEGKMIVGLTRIVDYFEDTAPAASLAPNEETTEEAMVEKFRQDFLESMESRQQRKPAPPLGAKGVKEQPKGPKLGGSRSIRAAMRQQEEQAAKNKR